LHTTEEVVCHKKFIRIFYAQSTFLCGNTTTYIMKDVEGWPLEKKKGVCGQNFYKFYLKKTVVDG